MALADLKRVRVSSRAQWRAWLEANHTQSESIWLVTWKKSEGARHVPYPDLVEEALCFGWIDSRAETVDERRSMLLMAPRRPGSAWSRLNKERVERLLAAGLMQPSGLQKIERAKRDGSWDFLNDVDALIVPADLAATLGPKRAAWDALPKSRRRGELEKLKCAKSPATRVRRIGRLLESL